MAFPRFEPWIFGTELVFTIIAVVFCFLIYFKTKESYELTKHQGIRHFRNAFLFFGLSYVLRFFLSLMFLSKLAFDIFLQRRVLIPFFILPLSYFSTIGIFYLLFSTSWKKIGGKHHLFLAHAVAIILSIITFFTRSHIILLYVQSILLIVAVILSFMKKSAKAISQAKVLYFLVAVLWLINLWIIGRPRPLSFEIDAIFEIISLAVFITIYYKVSKWVR